MKLLLTKIKDGEITKSNDPFIKKLLPTEWPELEIIKRSLEHDARSKLSESKKDLNTASEKEQLAAVEQNSNAIQYIENPSEAVQLAAIKQDCTAIYYIKNHLKSLNLQLAELIHQSIKYTVNRCLACLHD